MVNPGKNPGFYKVVIPFFALILISSFIVQPTTPKPKIQPEPVVEASHPYLELEGYQDLLELQSAFVRNAKKIKPSVVSINDLVPVKRSSLDPHHLSDNSWQTQLRNWLINFVRKEFRLEGRGSGVIIDEKGYILTNHHVVENAHRILVKTSDGRELKAKVVGVDPRTDLAVIKIFSFSGFAAPRFGDSTRMRVGDWIMAIGNPYGLDGTVTVGVVSGKERTNLGIATYEEFLQIDASINPGNSGGPLINLQGEIVGINTAVAAIGTRVGFAIPIEMAVRVAEELIYKGEVERGWLGVGIQPLTPNIALSLKIPDSIPGILVNSVGSGSPASQAGILTGDVIVRYGPNPVDTTHDLQKLVAGTEVGKWVPLQIIRNGKEMRVKVHIGRLTS